VEGQQVNDSEPHDLGIIVRLEDGNVRINSALDSRPIYEWIGPVTSLSRTSNGDSTPPDSLAIGSMADNWEVSELKVKRLATKLAKSSAPAGTASAPPWDAALRKAGFIPKTQKQLPDGTWEVDLTDVKNFKDVVTFQGARLSRLNLKATSVADLSSLRGMPLKRLNLERTKVTDLTPLRGMQLEELNVNCLAAVSDLSLLRGMPLQKLEINLTAVADLSPLRGMPIKTLTLHKTRVTDLQPISGMPLEVLNLKETAVTDLSALRGMPLSNLRLAGCPQLTDLSPISVSRGLTSLTLSPNAKNFDFLRTFPKLTRLSYAEDKVQGWNPAQSAAEFWKEYDAKNR
jgi:hypothetical protein